MKNKPLVSIFITTYNHERFISDCLDSVISQDYGKIEVIVGDDASTDNNREILLNYKNRYPDIIKLVLHDENIGITNNCNSILSLCKGKYIASVGGDDQMLPQKISKQVQYLEDHEECNMCFHNLEAFDSDTNKFLYYTHNDGNGNRKRDSGTIKDAIKEGVFFSPVSVMARAVNLPSDLYDKRIPMASDWLFYVDVLSKGGTVEYIDSVLGRYRRSNKSITIKRPEGFALEVDILNSINIMIVKYPQFTKEALYRYGQILFKMRNKNNNYFRYLIASLKVSLHIKGVVAFGIYLASAGNIKK